VYGEEKILSVVTITTTFKQKSPSAEADSAQLIKNFLAPYGTQTPNPNRVTLSLRLTLKLVNE